MSLTFKRLTFAFAALALGILGSLWVTMRVVAGQIVEDKTAPVKQQLLADWESHEARFLQALQATEVWASGGGATPATTGCRLAWAPAQHPAVAAHLARCKDGPPTLDEALAKALDSLGDEALAKEAELPALTQDLAWMAALRGHGDWSDATGTPYEFVDSKRETSILDWPLLDARGARQLATLRLVAGQRAGTLAEAVEDVTALARALLGRPSLPEQLAGHAVLRQLRAQLDAAGHAGLGPAKDFVTDLRVSRLAAAQLWHPWLPAAQRERLLPRLPLASRCAAAADALLYGELGEPFRQVYPGHVEALHAWRGAACPSVALQRAWDDRRTVAPERWQRLLTGGELLAADLAGPWPGLLSRLVEHDSAARRAAVEVLLAVVTARPFPPEAP